MRLKPCTAFAGNTLIEQLSHVSEEYAEVVDAWNSWQFRNGGDKAKMHMAEELTYLQTTCETMLLVMGFDAQERNKFKIDVAQKNWRRGYFKEVNTDD